MKWAAVGLGLLALAAGFALGRATAPSPEPEFASLDSLRQALADPNWLTRSHRLSGFLQHLSPENLPEALEVLESHLPWLVTDEIRMLMLAWTRFDAPGAFERARSWPLQYRQKGIGAALYAWAYRDPEGALRALESVDGEEREFLRKRLVAGWIHGERQDSVHEYIAALPEGAERFHTIGALAWEISKRGPEAVMRWAEAVPDVLPRYKAGVFLKASGTLASLDAPLAARWLVGHLGRPYAEGAVPVVATGWIASDPPAAMGWLTSLPPGERRDASVSNAFVAWHDRTPGDAEAWLRSATPAPALDPAVRVVVTRRRRASPAAALGWALALDDRALREQLVTEVARSWLRRDAAAADAWLERSGLPDELLEAIRAPARGGDGAQ